MSPPLRAARDTLESTCARPPATRRAARLPRAAGSLMLLATGLFSSCREPAGRFDLLADAAGSESSRLTTDRELIHEAQDDALGIGWSTAETGHRWALGEVSEIRIRSLRGGPLTLVGRVSGPPGQDVPYRMRVECAGSSVGEIEVAPEPRDFSIELPAAVVPPGDTVLRLFHPWARTASPTDARQVAVLFARLEIDGAGPEPPPPASGVPRRVSRGHWREFSWSRPRDARLAVKVRGAGNRAGRGRLRLMIQGDGGTPARELAAKQLGDGREYVWRGTLPGDPGDPQRLLVGLDEDAAVESAELVSLELIGEPPVVIDPEPAPPVATPPAVDPPKTILLVVVDALRADHLQTDGYPRPTSPRLMEFARDAEHFPDSWAVTSWTKPAVATLLSGRPPETHGAGGRLTPVRAEVPLLPELLSRSGWRTRFITASAYTSARFGFGRGIDKFADLTPADSHDASSPAVVAAFAAALRETPRDQPLFAYLHFVDPHAPYAPVRERGHYTLPEESNALPDWAVSLRSSLPVALWRNRIDRYDGEIEGVDAAFGEVLALLRDAGRLEGSLVIFTADHGEEFGEHGGEEHADTLQREVLRVPLLIRWPDRRAAGTRNEFPAEQMDVLPTVAGALGLPAPAGATGVDLRRAGSGGARVRLASLLDGDKGLSLLAGPWHYVEQSPDQSRPHIPRRALYRPGEDPFETRDLSERYPATRAWLAARTRLRHARLLRQRLPAGAEVADPELIARLRALGYLQ